MSKILVVEDDELLREFLRIKLTTQGYRVDTASDGMAAYQSLRRQRPDLILLDMM
ncbi:MAG: response regulator, partial [Alphaproteobacteria bacterium]|nr:response regulator [Alphaproteobacteria bacterium]